MSGLPVVAGGVSKLLPMLSSDRDGEVVATVRAISRTLASVGADWHDLAQAVEVRTTHKHRWAETSARTAYEERERRPWRPWSRLPPNEKVLALDAIGGLKLSPWERAFVASVDETLRGQPYARFTPKQAAVLDRLLARTGGW